MIKTQEYKSNWSLTQKTIFRFLFLYFGIYIILFFTASLFESPFRWIGNHLLGFNYSYNVSGNGSGDHTYAYITLLINSLLAFILLPIWSFLDKKRMSYNKLFYWFIVSLRIFLFGAMLLYGFVKIFKVQFPDTSLVKLMQPLGDYSPMGLAWAYMGFSKGFNVFAGIMEVIGGLLLISRKTQTLGAFIVIGVMTQVAMMNLFFDIPVKLFSIHLIFMGLTIFIIDIKRFTNVFIKNKTVESLNHYHPIEDKKYHKFTSWIKPVGVTLIVITGSIFLFQAEKKLNNYNKPLFYGVWETEVFIKNGDTLPPLITDKNRWRYLIIDKKNKAFVKKMNDSIQHFQFKPDPSTKKIKIYGAGEKSKKYNFNYKLIDSSTIILNGNLYYNNLTIKLKRRNLVLKSRGFNWINESPFNR